MAGEDEDRKLSGPGSVSRERAQRTGGLIGAFEEDFWCSEASSSRSVGLDTRPEVKGGAFLVSYAKRKGTSKRKGDEPPVVRRESNLVWPQFRPLATLVNALLHSSRRLIPLPLAVRVVDARAGVLASWGLVGCWWGVPLFVTNEPDRNQQMKRFNQLESEHVPEPDRSRPVLRTVVLNRIRNWRA